MERAFKYCDLQKDERILDVPCGTGILGRVLGRLQNSVVASDISKEMMTLAREKYERENFAGFVQSDIVNPCFKSESFCCVIILGLMHRVPQDLGKQLLEQVSRVSSNYLIVSYSVDSPVQRLKHWIIGKIWSGHKPAPSPVSLRNILEEFESLGLTGKKVFRVMRFLSSEVVFLLQKER